MKEADTDDDPYNINSIQDAINEYQIQLHKELIDKNSKRINEVKPNHEVSILLADKINSIK